MFDFANRPGLFFVWATLMPLASFVGLLLLGAVRNFARRYKAENGQAAQLFQMLGGDNPGKAGFYVATGAIGLAFVLSFIGFIKFLGESRHHDHHAAHGGDEHQAEGHDDLESMDAEALRERIARLSFKKQKAARAVKAERERLANELLELAKAKADPKADLAAIQQRVEFYEGKATEADIATRALANQIDEAKARLAALEGRWAGSITWASVMPRFYRENNAGHGTALKVGFYIDGLAAIMFVMVTFIATLIHIFASGYMAEELQQTVEDHEVHTAQGHLHRRGRFGRFYLFLSLFCFSMLNLVLADNLFQVFVSWELVGVCSYLLIGFYYERQSASNAANKAFITNRVGDAGFIIGLLIVWTYIGTFNFQEIFARVRAPEVAFSASDDPHYAGTRKPVDPQYAHRIVHGRPVQDVEVIDLVGTGEVSQRIEVAAPGESPARDSYVFLFPHNLPERANFHAVGPKPDPEDMPAHFLQSVVRKEQPTADDYGFMPYWMLVAAGLGIFLGCVGKSAQFPLHVWLPDAMEGPTPVSALIHAATMVAAGVYLVGRCFPLFTAEVLLTIAYTGAITLFVAATIAIVMTDIKKVLAYSTVSQLGYMMLGLGVGGWAAGLFHLVTHAFFKALMFLASGSVIYGCHHVQEMTRMGGLYGKMKITALTMLMGVLAIAGIPLFSGWYSKDAILASAIGFASMHPAHYLLFLLPLATAGITTFYMFRMWFMTFTGPPRDQHVYEHAHETPRVMTTPLIILAVCSVAVAWGWPLWDATASSLEHQLHHAQPLSVTADFAAEYEKGHHLHDLAGNLALAMVLVGLTFAALLYYRRVLDPAEARASFPGVYKFLAHKWYFDEFYSAVVVRPGLAVAGWARFFDTRVIDGFVNWLGRASVVVSRVHGVFDRIAIDGLVNLLASVSYGIGTGLRRIQTGFLRSYVLFLVLAAVGIWVLLTLFFSGGASGAP